MIGGHRGSILGAVLQSTQILTGPRDIERMKRPGNPGGSEVVAERSTSAGLPQSFAYKTVP